MNTKFPKTEKLKSRKIIGSLFKEGKSITKFPIKVLYLSSEKSETQVTFAVPKRNFKLAVTRNRIKRQMREAYRLQKGIIATSEVEKLSILFLYIHKEKPTYQQVYKAIGNLLVKVSETHKISE